MGVVLNRPSEIEVDDVAPELAEVVDGEPVFVGGPVQPQALVVLADFDDPGSAAWVVVDSVGFVAADTEYSDLASMVRRGRVYAGYSGWGAGQLEAELDEEAWIVEPPLPAELFAPDPEDLWPRRSRAQGRSVRPARPDARRPDSELGRNDGGEDLRDRRRLVRDRLLSGA